MTTTTRSTECTATAATLFLALELGSTQWKVACAVVRTGRPRIRTIAAKDLPALEREIVTAKTKLGLPVDAPVRSCYEAGRDMFWVHRALEAHGISNVVVDPSSIAVDRRQRRAKTDRVDATALVMQLMNAAAGDRRGWREVRVPSVAAEHDRQLQREWETVREDRKRLRNRISGLLATQGLRLALTGSFLRRLARARLWDGSSVPAPLVGRLEREWAALTAVEVRRRELERLRRARIRGADDAVATQTRRLIQLRGVAINGALTLSTELFAWRAFRNGRQLGAIVGLTPTPYRSDQSAREQGISRSGNRRVRALSIELAWAWLRHQPDSALSQWFHRRFGQHGRARRIGIVAVARKLVIALWRYADQELLPAGAKLKKA
jgi:transposase